MKTCYIACPSNKCEYEKWLVHTHVQARCYFEGARTSYSSPDLFPGYEEASGAHKAIQLLYTITAAAESGLRVGVRVTRVRRS